jgi:hypothetical protein
MRKPIISILSLSAALFFTLIAPLAAQTEPPPSAAQPAIIQPDTPPDLAEQPEADSPPQMESEPPAQPAVTQPDKPSILTIEVEAEQPEIKPPAPFQPATTQQETPPLLAEQDAPTPFVVYKLESERPEPKTRIPPPPHSSAFVLPAGFISTSARVGYRKYDGVHEYQHVERGSMFIYGGVAGKRFALENRMVRFQTAVEVGWGSKKEDTYDDEVDNTTVEVHEYINLSIFGIQTDMHILFPDKTRAYFLSLGPGLHRSSFSFSLRGNGNQILWKSKNLTTLSPSFNIGAGMEYTLNDYRAMSLAYSFRIWNPVSYIEVGDLFPMGVNYEEFFYSHSFHIQILLPGTKKGKFR